ncbi:hypothetical protein NGRA_2739 [Nosema granulosis]|uniref:Uncharacterized protein n=1 Tax=Nosema granulosis TaxID=83296 RepID=A0A9P6KXW6_9MICR|nr:hypothetical protein NGRA_2739 [Nosema granulosis]
MFIAKKFVVLNWMFFHWISLISNTGKYSTIKNYNEKEKEKWIRKEIKHINTFIVNKMLFISDNCLKNSIEAYFFLNGCSFVSTDNFSGFKRWISFFGALVDSANFKADIERCLLNFHFLKDALANNYPRSIFVNPVFPHNYTQNLLSKWETFANNDKYLKSFKKNILTIIYNVIITKCLTQDDLINFLNEADIGKETMIANFAVNKVSYFLINYMKDGEKIYYLKQTIKIFLINFFRNTI